MAVTEQELSTTLSRRALLQGICLSGAALALPSCISGPSAPPYAGPGLRDLAQGRFIGTALDARHLRRPDYAAAIAKHANIIVPENDLKWRVIQPREGEFDFTAYDQLATFARTNKMKMRGHTLVWHTANPEWAQSRLEKGSKAEVTAMLEVHINSTLQHTANDVTDWDVVNEAVDPNSQRPDFLRENTPWLKALNLDYVPMAFDIAHRANPALTLTYNDYSLEYADGPSIARRDGVLRLLRALKRQGIAIHQLGLQSHLACHRPLGGEAFITFLKQVKQLGIKVAVTELDLKLEKLPGSDADRLQQGAHYAATYLNMLQQVQPLDTVLTWGLASPYSFMQRKDWSVLDPLPLDEDMHPLPLWNTLRDAWLTKKKKKKVA